MGYVMPERLSDSQLNALSIIERTCSSLSLMGCVIIIATFTCSTKFRKPINRIMFYATFGNLLTNVATLMARAYIESPDSGPCQFQGFLIQMFMPADAYWTLAMAVNVHLTFYNRFDARRLRSMEIPYVFLCYGVPFIPALTFLFVRDHAGGRPYGDATLWCWLTSDWDIYRIAVFYAPVWFTSFITIAIYVRAGRKIFGIRKQLQSFEDTADFNTSTVRTTKISITSECSENAATSFPLDVPIAGGEGDIHGGPRAYSVSISAVTLPPSAQTEPLNEANQTTTLTTAPAAKIDQPRHHRTHLHMPHLHLHGRIHGRHSRTSERRRAHAVNKAAWSYTKCAMLFFFTMFVTWIPSSANRVYSFIHKDRSLAPLEFMSAFVLPLQGFWNFAIYAVFSWTSFVALWDESVEAVSRLAARRHAQQAQPWKSGGRDGRSDSVTELATNQVTQDRECLA
ncbi:hypothetical protein BROUX41_003684 [Berkeleyomyces rouxiae]|uniref:uncharacterized protein n=1 Tax=Berkeleyomyces rouxiae TaxID=2035830 RepID=UPI003B7F3EB7